MRIGLAIAVIATALASCATREAAYRFRAPLVSSVRAAPLPEFASSGQEIRPTTPAATPPAAPPPSSLAPVRPEQLPAPHRAPPAQEAAPSGTDAITRAPADILRGLVGQRDKQATHLAFAIRALAAIGIEVDPPTRDATTGRDLVSLARRRDALSTLGLSGDLIVFDHVTNDGEATLVGVVIAVHERVLDRGTTRTTEFVYLARNVVRRGYVTPDAPRTRRDRHGRALNTFVRHRASDTPRNARFLAGELFRTFVQAERLAR